MTTEGHKVHLTGTRYHLAALLVVLTISVGVALLVTATDSRPTTIGLFAAMVAIGLIFFRPTVGLWLLLLTLPFQQIVPINLPIGSLTLPRTITLVTVAALVVQNLILPSNRRRSLRTPFDRALYALVLAWLVSSVLSIRIAPDAPIYGLIVEDRIHLARQHPFIKSYTEIISYLVSVAVLYVMSGLLTSTKLTRLALKFWIMGAAIACLIGMYATIAYYYNLPIPVNYSNTFYLSDPGSFAEVTRIRSVASEPRFFTYYVITILPFLIITGLYKQYVISRNVHLGAVVLASTSFWLTMSRSMIVLGLAMVVLLPIIMAWGGSKLSRRRNSIVILGRVVVALAILLGLASVMLFLVGGANLANAFSGLAETINPYQWSISAQLINNIVALNIFLHNPVLGVGIGNFAFWAGPSAVPSWSPILQDANDTVTFVTSVYLQTLSEVGIVGFVVLLYLFGTIGRLTIRIVQLSRDETWTATAIGLMGSFLMIVVAVAFIPNFFYPETWVVLGFIAIVSRHVASGQQLSTMTQSERSAEALQLSRPQAALELDINNGKRRHA